MNMNIPKVAAAHDISGFGRGSLMTIIPILSTMKIQVCPVPTAVLSTHTGDFEDYTFIDLTDYLQDYINHWKHLDLKFDCIYTGFLGSIAQIEIMIDFIKRFRTQNNIVVIDPVMGDNGKLYASFNNDIIKKMRTYIKDADIITPNITEAAYLLGEEYKQEISETLIINWLKKLTDMGPKTVIITSVPSWEEKVSYVYAYDSVNKDFWRVTCDYIEAHYPGTGDGFTSVVIGSLLQGDSLPMAIERATVFMYNAIQASYKCKFPEREGVLIEKNLCKLNDALEQITYEKIIDINI